MEKPYYIMAIKGRVPLYFIIVRIGDRAKAIIIIVTDIFFPTGGLAAIPSISAPSPAVTLRMITYFMLCKMPLCATLGT